MAHDFFDQLPTTILQDLTNDLATHQHTLDCLTTVIDASGLPCPMPLLKAKVALRDIADGYGVYIIANDKNSQTDLIKFCQKNELIIHHWTRMINEENQYHFAIFKPINN